MTLKAVIHASEILTGVGIREKDGRKPVEEDLGRIEDGALIYRTHKVSGQEVPDKIVWTGKTSDLPKKYLKLLKKNLHGKQALIPGLVDCHTHLVFAGNRSAEFAARCAGATYEQIAAQGGGINATVMATRATSAQELERLAIARVQESRSHGVRTLEVKSGYGLSLEAELKILEVIPKLRKQFPDMTLTSTFLGAHAFPPDQTREAYMNCLMDEILPEVARRKLADSCDIFVDRGYYSVEEARVLLKKAARLGLKVKVHADELVNTESAQLAVDLKALSADHLLKVSEQGIAALGKSDTVAVLLPGTAFYLKEHQAPARKLMDAGARVALATDFNPGTCVTLSLPTIMTMAALYLGMSRAEIFAATTYNAARALGLHSRKGTLQEGMDADFVILPFAGFEELYYRFAWSGQS